MGIQINGQTDTISAVDGSFNLAGTVVANSGTVTVGTGATVHSPATNVLTLGTNDSERVRITSAGKVFLPGSQTDSNEAGRLDIYHTADDGINNPHIRLWGPANQDARIEFGSPTNTGEGGYIMYNDSDEGLYIGSRMGSFGEVNLCTGMNDGSPTSNVRLRIDGNGTAYINGSTQFTNNGGLNIEQTASGSESVVLGLSNQGTADGSGIIISFRGKDDAGNQNDYGYIKMVADDTGNGSEDSSLRFWTQNAGTLGEAARFTAAGNLQFPNGQGIDFSLTTDGTGTPSSDLLDDYEEGTFTPTVASTSVNVSYSNQEGYYTKVGNMVHFSFQINISGVVTNGSGDFTIGGLPYSASNSAGRYVIQTSSVNFDSTGYDHYAYLGSATTLKVLKGNDNAGWTVVQVGDFSLTTGSIITLQGTYRTPT